MYKTRTRMISFRLSEDEYQRLKDLSLLERARSVSDFARSALCRLPDGSGMDSRDSAARLEALEGDVQQLRGELHELRQLVEAASRRPPVARASHG